MEKLGNILVRSGQLTYENLEEALIKSFAVGRRIGWVLVEEGLVSEQDLAKALARQLNMDMVDLDSTHIALDAVTLLPRRVALTYRILPIRVEGRQLTIAAADPTNVTIDDVVRATTGLDVRTVVAASSSVDRYIERYYPDLSEDKEAHPDSTSPSWKAAPLAETDARPQELETVAAAGLIIQSALTDAVRRSIRGLGGQVAGAEHEHSINVRGSSTAVYVTVESSLYAEKIAITVSDRQQDLTRLDALGMVPQDVRLVESWITSPQGLILVAGPPMSGKTTTLYAILHRLRQSSRRIVTVETPVAHPVPGVHQLPADPKAGITPADMLRAALQLAPEIIVLSDLSTRTTARAALEAAAGGYLVAAAIEARSALSALTQLTEGMLLPPQLVADGLLGVIAQRLVRKIDPVCKESYWPDSRVLIRYFGTADRSYIQPVYRGKGCRLCDGGYRGRTGLFEVLPITTEIRSLIERRAPEVEFAATLGALGTTSLRDDGIDKALSGATTLEELDRVIGSHYPSPELAHAAG